jgi:NAD(P)-dependent dehydrogenase (short-subunit alcohol dehydrogenase family)
VCFLKILFNFWGLKTYNNGLIGVIMYAIVTGASSGLGLSMSKFLISKDYTVIAASRKLIDISHDNFHHISVDIRDENSVVDFFHEVEQITDEVQLFVNNAGICEMSSVGETETSSFENQLTTNVTGTFHMLKGLEDLLVDEETHIINILSTAAHYGYPNVSAYTASMHAMEGLLKSVKKEWSDYKIKFTNLYPGAIDTPLWDKMNVEFSRDKMLTIEEFMHVFEMVALAPPMVQFPEVTFLHKEGFLE